MARYFARTYREVVIATLLTCNLYSQIESDKLSHFLGGYSGGAFAYEYTYQKTNNRNKAFVGGLLGSLVVGSAKEFYDSKQLNNSFDKNDLLATFTGGLIVSLTFNILKKNKNEKIHNNLVRNYRKYKRKRARKKR